MGPLPNESQDKALVALRVGYFATLPLLAGALFMAEGAPWKVLCLGIVGLWALAGYFLIDPYLRALRRQNESLDTQNRGLMDEIVRRAYVAEKRVGDLEISEETLKNRENFLHSILDSISDGVVVAGQNGRPILWNPAAERILTPDLAEVPVFEWARYFGFYLADCKTPFPEAKSPFARTLKGESVKRQEIFMKRGGGGVWLSVSARPLVVLAGKEAFEGAVLVFRNITEQKKADRALAKMHFELEQNEEKYRTLVTNLPGVVYRCEADAGRHIRFMTESSRDVFGYSPEEFLLGRPLMTLVHPEDSGEIARQWSEAVEGRKPYVFEYRVITGEGTVRWVHDKGRVVVTPGGVWGDGVVFDVTHRKMAEQKLIEKTAELARSQAEREQLELFAFVASHDLRDPLQKIMGFSDLVKISGEPLGQERSDYLSKIQKAVRRMGQLIDDLLKFTRVSTQAEPFAEVSLEAVVREALCELELQIKKTGADVRVAELPVIRGDRLQLCQLFQNLIGNSLKFHRPDCPPSVSIYANEPRDGASEIVVEDNGIGFDQKYLGKIFKPFERLHLRNEYEGSGIGLAICQRVALRHGGTISAESTPGVGTKFFVRLPVLKPARVLP